MTVVTLYGKPDCCLCDEAKAAIDAVRAERPFELQQVDVTQDPELERRYGERLPVVAIDGVDAFELHVDPSQLTARLDAGGPVE